MKKLNILDTKKAIEIIKELVCCYYQTDKSILKNKSRKSKSIKIKHICVYLSKKHLGITTVKTGEIYNLDHSMVVYIIKKINGFLDWDAEFKKEIKDIEEALESKIYSEENIDSTKYYISLNDFYSIKLQENKAIILKGFSKNEINSIKLVNKDNGIEYISIFEPIKHINQNFYILEENEKNSNTG